MVVVLPAPLEPMKPTTLPASTLRSTPSQIEVVVVLFQIPYAQKVAHQSSLSQIE